jgi:lysozyme family protein
MPISASVGKGGVNRHQDTAFVQVCLNVSRRQENHAPIRVDGIVGPITIGAITDFQRANRLVADGRVDPGGPTITALESRIATALESQLRSDMLLVLNHLSSLLTSRRRTLPPGMRARVEQIESLVLNLRGGSGAQGDSIQPAIYWTNDSPRFVLAVAPAAAAAGAAAAAAEAMILALLATIALLLLIQSLPHLARAVEDLIRRIQVLMAQLLDTVNEAVRGIEELIRNNPRAGMRCSDVIIRFRQQTADL